ncbi:CIC11C00000003265 [Sungouiella intermedia]|uniref:CIC11C00000003265 n=1 Tax=Sungouiella intermedia TaxID=45354 RepID=A0A1L0CUF2_9ASCO|nr:CIC11C00000003265 [[Candida] intermedia]
MVPKQSYYSKGFSKEISDTHAWRTVANAVPYVIPYLKKSDKLLDVGLGPGSILKDFANYVGEVVGVETIPDLIEISSNQPDLPSLVLFQLGLAYNLPFEDASFDVVHALQVVIHLSEPEKALKEMLRVCKPGGYVLVKDADLQMTVVYPQKYHEGIADYFHHKSKDLTTLSIAGRLLKSRALAAGYNAANIHLSALVWTISTDKEREDWANMYCKRITKAKQYDYTSNPEQLDRVIRTFKEWKEDSEGLMMMTHGELVYRK